MGDEVETYEFDQKEMEHAAEQEELERANAEVSYLRQRVMLLRAVINRLENEKAAPVKNGEGVESAD